MMMRSFNFVPLLVIFLASARIEIVARGFTRLGMILSPLSTCFVLFRFAGGRGRDFFLFFFLDARVRTTFLWFFENCDKIIV